MPPLRGIKDFKDFKVVEVVSAVKVPNDFNAAGFVFAAYRYDLD